MPFLFIHGVNVRDEKATINDAQVLAKELGRHVVEPLARDKVGAFDRIGISPEPLMFVPFWGDVGVKFRWNLRTLPAVRLTNMLGGTGIKPGDPLPGQAEVLAELLADAKVGPGEPNPLLQAARHDLKGFLDAIFAPTVFEGEPFVKGPASGLAAKPDPHHDAQAVGPRGEALLVEVLHELATDATAIQVVRGAMDDRQLLNGLQDLVLARLDQRVHTSLAPAPPAPGTGQPLGTGPGLGAWYGNAKARVGEFFGRVRNAPVRAATVATLAFKRESWNESLTRFTGDVFEYLHHRGNKAAPGEIIKRVLAEITAAEKARPGEPWFVVTHSMGGNIFYDILTHYRTDLEIEVWLSVAGQVGLFEEMKLFHASDPLVKLPVKVTPNGGRVTCWLNIYDPADPFAYLAKPVFATVADDVEFSTGAGWTTSHSAYFKQRSFFELLLEETKGAYKATP